LSGYENELDLEAQREALASWKAAQELARSEQENKPDLSTKGTESDVEAQRAAIASWNKAHELAQEEPISANVSVRDPSPEGRVKVTSPKGEKTAEKRMHKPQKADKERKKPTRKPEKAGREKERHARETPDPVRVMVDRTIAQDKSRHERRKTPRAMEPVGQIDPKSYIGLAFKRLGGKDKRTPESSSEDGSSSDESLNVSKRKRPKGKKNRLSSSSSEPSSTSESSGSSTDTDDRSFNSGSSSSSSNSCSSRRRRRRNKHSRSRGRGTRRKKRSRSKRRKSHHRMKLKPIPPVEYDGSVDSKAFHRFITEGTAYVKDGEVPSKKQVFILSHYLKGKAHEFYVREVSGDPYRWRLSTFFRELFNYCFPVDFRIKLRKKLHTCYQGSRTVWDYLYELNEMWNMIGETDERTKVHKLWFGLRKEIQHDLWRDKLNPEISSLRAVIASAEIIEIAQSVTGGGPESKNKRRENSPVVRSAAMTPDGERRRKRERGRSAKKND